MMWLYTSVTAVLLDYGGFQIQFDCNKRSADRFQYNLPRRSNPAVKRPKDYRFDPNLTRDCQQTSVKSYYENNQPAFDRGHLVTSGHMDSSEFMRKQANYMTNIVPQVRSFNQGIWSESEKITECFRSESPTVYGGLVYSDPSNDFFMDDHKIPTPEYMWRVIVSGRKVYAWYFPNQENLGPLSLYAVTVAEIESRLNDGLGPIPIDNSLKSIKMEPPNWMRCSKNDFIRRYD